MKKCPRCHYDITDEDKYCPHCGLDLQRQYRPIHRNNNNKKRNLPITLLLYGVILFAFVCVPLLYSQILGGLSNNLTTLEENNTDLPAISNTEPRLILQTFDTLADYKEKYSNVSEYVTRIQDYEKTLSDKLNSTFDKKYNIQVLDNYNVLYQLEYTAKISDQYEITIVREYDRAHTYNNEITTLKKKNAGTFEELIFNDEEKDMINKLVDDSSTINKLVDEFSKRKDEFNAKKETLGHYGLGTYHSQASFVVHRYDDVYQSELKYEKEVKDYLG